MFFSFLEQYPLATITSLMSVVIIIVFLTTSADSAALVVDLLSGDRARAAPPQAGQRASWTLLLGGVAGLLLLAWAAGCRRPAERDHRLWGCPFCALLAFMAVALTRALHADYLGYSMEDLAAGRTPPMDPMGSKERRDDR
ncbi:MAG: BCCT family transporter [Gammaproteobacteria bacterium]|nr:BCCT family transporter [Gammaproteobacteria bacterium]